MDKNQVLKVAAGTMVVATVPALAAACGGDDDNKEATQAVATQPLGNTAAATQAPAKASILFIDLDTVRGSANLTNDEKATQSCVQVNQFAKNEQVVFRMRVYDPATGQPLDDTKLDKVEVKLKDGTVLPASKYGPHPKDPPNDSFWTTSWTVPATYATGSVDYTITAVDKEGRTGTFTPIRFPATTMLQVLDKVRTIIPAP